MNVEILDGPSVECEDYVRREAQARLCHTPSWSRMVEKVFGHRGYYLVARDQGGIRGVLPLTHVRSRLFANRMISQAFSDYGGPLVSVPDALEPLYRRAVEIAGQVRCPSIEFRNVVALPYDVESRTDKVAVLLPLTDDPQGVWASLGHKTRNRIRKAEKEGFVVKSGGPELLDEFYRAWTIRMHQLGTPCYARKLFAGIMQSFPAESRIFVATLRDVTAAVLFVCAFGEWAQSCWGTALREYDSAGPNYILNWMAIEHYCRQGCKWFDFGRSTVGSSQFEFKRRWGGTVTQLYYQYWTAPGHALSPVRPDNPRYQGLVHAWRKLPLSLTRFAGPLISRSLA
ncbi:MAG: FemAB family XrtA/PEP-CTERM system-associated protein [Phycisphaerales bacterium]